MMGAGNSAKDGTMQQFRLERPGQVDLVFDGDLLSEVSTYERGKRRWVEIRIYKTTTDKWVVDVFAPSIIAGETNRTTVTVCDTAMDVRKALTRENREGVRYLTDTALDALEDAADKDPDLYDATIDTI